jgi:hypothetical protein
VRRRDKLGVPKAGHEVLRMGEPVRAVLFAHRLRQQRPSGNLDPFDRIDHGQAQLTVKNVEIEHILEGGALEKAVEAVRVVVHLQRQRVAGQPVVADESEVVPGNRFVGDRETTLPKQRYLGVDMDGGLGESHEQ